MRDASLGVYVHVPFCERVCPYCDFAVVAARRLSAESEDAYVDALVAELAARRGAFSELRLASLYLGGGTPSLLRPASVARIVEAVRGSFPALRDERSAPGGASADVEITLEVNPSTLERARLPGFREAGVSRVSVGVQSFDDTLLRRLGRAHRAPEAHATLGAVRDAGFANVSLDLIHGVPGQRLDDLRRDLATLLAYAPEHVSAYELTIEPGTPYATATARGQLVPPGEETAARMHEEVAERLAAAGYEAYELSSHARPGFASRHNRRYWERQPVLGVGVGAWSIEPRSAAAPFGARRENVRALPTYLERIRAGRSAAAAPAEVLGAATARGEAMFLGLRTRRGVDAARFAEEFGAPPRRFFGVEIERTLAAGLLEEASSGSLRLTARGRLLSDSVFAGFVADAGVETAGAHPGGSAPDAG